MAADVSSPQDDEYAYQHRPAGTYVGPSPKGRLVDIPGGANADEQREEHRREIAGLTHEQIDQEKLDYIQGLGITVETLQRWAIERGHAQKVMLKLADKVVELQHDLAVLQSANTTESTILTRLAEFLGISTAKAPKQLPQTSQSPTALDPE